ncbi:tubulin polymerization-promoting protein family member 2-like [Watersipora subatra]|uniref:tubulin polymerization-promoting protein family member 2-like n=1 Tax=Watersipora subatra TaxID=2589382 RepID=UPI00355B37A6
MAASESDLCSKFEAFCSFGSGNAAKKTLTTKNCTKIFKDCKLYGKALTSTDTDIAFSKVKTKGKTEITLAEFNKLLEEVAPKYMKDAKKGSKEEAIADMKQKICERGPSTAGTTGTSKTGGVSKMTDASLYTGSHAERFDKDGKGKGIEGRENVADNSGYVGAYKEAGTYDKKH